MSDEKSPIEHAKATSSGFVPSIALEKAFHDVYIPGFTESKSAIAKLLGGPKENIVADLTYGNPHELCSPAIVECYKKWLEPQHENWYAYTMNNATAVEAISKRLSRFASRSPGALKAKPWDSRDIFVTTGAVAGLNTAISALVNPADEVIFLTPKWSLYQAMIRAAGGKEVPVALRPPGFRLDMDHIRASMTSKTVAIIINSPHNPTGRVVTAAEWKGVADVLRKASEEFGHPVWLIHDAPYIDLVLDGKQMVMPSNFYEYTITVYSFGKVHLTPGNRIGYLAVNPYALAEDKAVLRVALVRKLWLSWSFANAPLQYGVPELLELSISVKDIERRRDVLVRELRSIGYEFVPVEGTFYLFGKVPTPAGSGSKEIGDDMAFSEYLATKYRVAVIPGSAKKCDGYFRLSLTEQLPRIKAALPALRAAYLHFTQATGRSKL